MRRIGIMGGTFNPIHNMHLAMAEKAREQFSLEKVLFLPSGIPYMKNLQEVLPASVRCEMTALAIADIPYFELSEVEVSDVAEGKNTYTYATLEKLRRVDPEAEYYFILGADSLFAIEEWKNPERIFQSCTILAAVRSADCALMEAPFGSPLDYTADSDFQNQLATQISHLQEKYHASIAMLSTPAMNISSTQIRNFAADGMSIHGLVPEAVEHYILHNHLYQKQIT